MQSPKQFERRAAPHTAHAVPADALLEELGFVPMMLVAAGVERYVQRTRVVCLVVVAQFVPEPVGFRQK